MGISVEGQKCPVCGAYIFDNDDLVFCPECGAPHHRECYNALGRCAYQDKHGTPDGYKKPDPPKNNEEEPSPHQEHRQAHTGGQGTMCRACGEMVPMGARSCPNCGEPIAYQAYTPFGTPIMLDPLGGVSPDEDIDGVSAKDMGNYVAVNTQRYIPRFKRMSKEKRGSFNWAACLFPYAWYFYRKMYLQGIFFFIITAMLSMVAMSYIDMLAAFPDEALINYATLVGYIRENISTINLTPFYLSLGGLAAELVLRVISGFVGDRIYKGAVIEKIKAIKNEDLSEDIPLNLYMRRKGGVNPIAGIIALFGLQWAATLLATFI